MFNQKKFIVKDDQVLLNIVKLGKEEYFQIQFQFEEANLNHIA